MGVFSDGIEIRITGGTQEFDPSDLAAAIEFKYVKNINYLRYRPDDENSKYRDIANDIERFGYLSDNVDRRCVVFANYDLLRRAAGVRAEQELESLSEQVGVELRFVLPEPVDSTGG